MTTQRVTRLEAILGVLQTCVGEGGCSRREVADLLGMSKSPYLIELLEKLVTDEWAIKTVDTTRWPHRISYRPSERLLAWTPDKAA